MRLIGPAAFLLLAAISSASFAMTIEEAVHIGLANNPELRAGEAEEGAAETDVTVAKGGYYPSLSVSGGPRSERFNGLSYDVTAAQMLYDWGRTASIVDSAKATRRRLSEQLRQKREDAALAIVEAYLDILVTHRQLIALRTHVADLEAIRQMTMTRIQGGYADRSETERASLELARAREQLAIEEGTLENARHEFALLVGREAEDLTEPAPASVAAFAAKNDLDMLIEDSPASGIAAEDTRSAEAKLAEARSSLRPQLNLEGSVTRRDIGGIPRDDSIVALRFRMPTLQGFTNFLRPQGARQRVESARWAEQTVARDQRREVQTLFDNATMLRVRQITLEAQVQASGEVGETYFEQFRIGRRDLIDLLNTRREHFEARRQLVNTGIDRLRLEYRAAAKLGLIHNLLEKELY